MGDFITGPDWSQIFFLSSYIKVKLNADGITILLVNNHLLAVKALVFNAGDRSKRGERGRIENRARNSNLFMLLPITCFVCFSLKLSTKGKILTRKTITKHGEPGRMSVRTSRQEAGWQKIPGCEENRSLWPREKNLFSLLPRPPLYLAKKVTVRYGWKNPCIKSLHWDTWPRQLSNTPESARLRQIRPANTLDYGLPSRNDPQIHIHQCTPSFLQLLQLNIDTLFMDDFTCPAAFLWIEVL